jgi:hypothetical protein
MNNIKKCYFKEVNTMKNNNINTKNAALEVAKDCVRVIPKIPAYAAGLAWSVVQPVVAPIAICALLITGHNIDM